MNRIMISKTKLLLLGRGRKTKTFCLANFGGQQLLGGKMRILGVHAEQKHYKTNLTKKQKKNR